MAGAGIAGVTRRRFRRTTRPDNRAEPAPDLVERDFSADRPDRLWVADATYIPTLEGFLYLAVCWTYSRVGSLAGRWGRAWWRA